MLQRYSIALAGACVVTLVLMYGMSFIAEFFTRPDSQVYLRVMDVIPGSNARRLPDVRMPEDPPQRARLEVEVDAAEATAPAIGFEQTDRRLELEVELPRPDDAP